MKRALLLDLDDTLVVEAAAAAGAFAATAEFAAGCRDVEAVPLAAAARTRARELWNAAPTHPYCLRIGISSSEGLWCRFAGSEPETRALREWSREYRRETWRLALVTNGASCLQREKLAASGLSAAFDAVVVSAELGIGKPDGSVFRRALSALGCESAGATMVGDSLARDIDGARAAGLAAVWINRAGEPRPADRPDLVEITTLAGLAATLDDS